MKKRLLAGLLSLCLMLSMVPATALALDDSTETEPVATDTTSNSATSQDDTQDSSMENDSTETGTGDENTAETETTTDSETAAEETMVAEVGDAQYATLEKAIAAAQDGDTVTLLEDVFLTPTDLDTEDLNPLIRIGSNITLDLNKKTIKWDESIYKTSFKCTPVFFSIENAEVTITGDGTIDSELGYNNSYGINIVKDGKLVVENGTFTGATTAVQVTTGELTILDGFFKQAKTIASAAPQYAKYVVNAIDKNWEEGTARIYIKGGRFCFDPANKPENTESTYVAEGYVTTSEENDGSTFYTVEAATAKTDSKYYATLAEAVQAVVSSESKTGTVTLLKDAVGGGIGLFNAKDAVNVNLTIDFGGFTYTCDDPAVGSVGTESQGFHLEKGYTVTLKNGTIKVSPDSQNTSMLIQNYCNLTLENLDLYGSNITKYIISSNYGATVLKNVNIDGTNNNIVAIDLMHWLNDSYKDQAPTMKIRNDADNTIKGSIDVYCYGTGAAECQNKPKLTISGGHYTVDPSAYLETGYAAAASNKDGYVYQVVKASGAPAEVVPEAPKVENKLPDNASADDKELAASVSEKLNNLVVDEDIVKAAAGTVASQNEISTEQGKAELDKANIITDDSNVTIVVQPYLDVTLTNATSGEQKSFTADITPMYRTVATTNVDNIVVKGEATGSETVNAVVIGESKELSINKTVEVTIPLPTDFVASGRDKLYIHHQKNGITYVYEGAVTGKALTFTNPHGFSLFTITSAAPQAKIGEVNYATLQDAVNVVQNGGTIELLAAGSATVSREVTFMIIADGNFTADITAGSGYKLTRDGNTYTITEKSNSGGGVSHPTWDGSSSSSDRYDIDKPSNVDNGSIKVSPSSRAEAGDTVTITVTPDEGYELDELVVYDADGDEVDLDDEGDGAYTFEMPKSDVEIEVSFARISDADDETPVAAFVDVADSDWYADAVQYVFANGLMAGTSDTTFSPNATTTRAMIVTILYRLEGTPAVTGTTAFTDVAAGQYYADAVVWAAQNGIVSGTSATTFSPDGVITREQMAAILYRYAQHKGYDVTAKADLSMFTDAAQVSTYATDAMAWANASGLISGTSATTLSPAGSATRAQVATILMRFCENIAK